MYRMLMSYRERLPVAMKAVEMQEGTYRQCIYSPHSLRATSATRSLDLGVDITKVQDLLGHRQITTAQVYDKWRVFQIMWATKSPRDARDAITGGDFDGANTSQVDYVLGHLANCDCIRLTARRRTISDVVVNQNEGAEVCATAAGFWQSKTSALLSTKAVSFLGSHSLVTSST